MNSEYQKETITCPYCNESKSSLWATENGYSAVKCQACGLIYVNPRPAKSLISEAVKTGVHRDVEHGRSVIGKRQGSKVSQYKKIISTVFHDKWAGQNPISWIDVGAGYGEVIEAVSMLAPKGSLIVGLEPMKPKADHARSRGLKIQESYLTEVKEKYDVLSLINVYSHIPDFRDFVKEARNVLTPHGEIFVETGNTADLKSRREVPGDLDLPDHLVFAGENHLTGYLREGGFSIVSVNKSRVDGILKFAKNLIKIGLGRKNVPLTIPYTSSYRSLLIRARLD
jgi:SAM-dependent methyltransferase